MFENVDLVHRYTRADALRDGVLIDVSAVAREAGIRYPVALTRADGREGFCVQVSGPDSRCLRLPDYRPIMSFIRRSG